MFDTILAASRPLADLPPGEKALIFIGLAIFGVITALISYASPTDAARARRRRKYANRCYREGRTYTPRPHLHVTGRSRGYHLFGFAPDPRMRADGVPYIRREPPVAVVPEIPAASTQAAADKKAAKAKAAKKKAYDAAHRCVWTGLDKDVRNVAVVCIPIAVAVSSAIAVAAS